MDVFLPSPLTAGGILEDVWGRDKWELGSWVLLLAFISDQFNPVFLDWELMSLTGHLAMSRDILVVPPGRGVLLASNG